MKKTVEGKHLRRVPPIRSPMDLIEALKTKSQTCFPMALVKTIVNDGPLNATDSFGWSALHYAVLTQKCVFKKITLVAGLVLLNSSCLMEQTSI